MSVKIHQGIVESGPWDSGVRVSDFPHTARASGLMDRRRKQGRQRIGLIALPPKPVIDTICILSLFVCRVIVSCGRAVIDTVRFLLIPRVCPVKIQICVIVLPKVKVPVAPLRFYSCMEILLCLFIDCIADGIVYRVTQGTYHPSDVQ